MFGRKGDVGSLSREGTPLFPYLTLVATSTSCLPKRVTLIVSGSPQLLLESKLYKPSILTSRQGDLAEMNNFSWNSGF